MTENKNHSNFLTKTIIICGVIIAALSTYILLTNDLVDKPMAGQGGEIGNEALIGGAFNLTDQNGNQFTHEDLEGRVSLIYFGFTFCPDICPTSLQKINKVITTLDKYNMPILPIFITVDPARDNQDLLKEYLAHFNKKLVGLTGSEQEIRKVADAYKVYFAIAQNDDKNNEHYMLDHSSFVYLMDRNGKYVKHFYMNSPAQEIIDYIRVNYHTL